VSSLPEIEAAADALSMDQQWELLKYLAAKLGRSYFPSGMSLHGQMKDFCGIIDSGISDLGSNNQCLNGLGQ